MEAYAAARWRRSSSVAQHLVLAGRREAEGRRVPVRLRVLGEVLEAPIAPARAPGGVGVDAVEVVEHGLDRAEEAVQVEAPEADRVAGDAPAVVVAQPGEELDDLRVPPHPRGKRLNAARASSAVPSDTPRAQRDAW
jgi:hypothetical protein